MRKLFSSLAVATVAFGALAGAAKADVVLVDEGFETGENHRVISNGTWTGTDLAYRSTVENTGWTSGTVGDRAAIVYPYQNNSALISEAVDTSAYDQVRISFDMRPGNGMVGGGGAQLKAYGTDGKLITRFYLKQIGTAPGAGDINGYDGKDTDTGIDWTYGENELAHFDLLINQTSDTNDSAYRTWTLTYTDSSGSHSYTGSWLWGIYSGSEGTFDHFAFQGANGPGNIAYNEWFAMDSFQITGVQEIPEPATMTLLGLGGLAMLRRRRA